MGDLGALPDGEHTKMVWYKCNGLVKGARSQYTLEILILHCIINL